MWNESCRVGDGGSMQWFSGTRREEVVRAPETVRIELQQTYIFVVDLSVSTNQLVVLSKLIMPVSQMLRQGL